MKLKLVLTILLSLPLSGCFVAQKSMVIPSKQNYDKESQARIRIFGQYGNKTISHYVATCENRAEAVKNERHSRVVNGLPRRIKNISLNMPITQRSFSASNDTGIVFRDSFKEYVIDANKSLVFQASFRTPAGGNYDRICKTAITFKPIAGKNYEAYPINNNEKCTIQINEILNKVNDSHFAITEEVEDVKGCAIS